MTYACCRRCAWRGGVASTVPSAQALLTIVAGLLYFVSPLDAIPDWLRGIGLLDDLAVLAWVLKTFDSELAAFRAWRNRQSPEKLRVVERLPDTPEALRLEQGKR